MADAKQRNIAELRAVARTLREAFWTASKRIDAIMAGKRTQAGATPWAQRQELLRELEAELSPYVEISESIEKALKRHEKPQNRGEIHDQAS